MTDTNALAFQVVFKVAFAADSATIISTLEKTNKSNNVTIQRTCERRQQMPHSHPVSITEFKVGKG